MPPDEPNTLLGHSVSRSRTSAEAAQLVIEHKIVDVFDDLPGVNADVFLRLGNGQALGFWAGSDYGPSYWVLYDGKVNRAV